MENYSDEGLKNFKIVEKLVGRRSKYKALNLEYSLVKGTKYKI